MQKTIHVTFQVVFFNDFVPITKSFNGICNTQTLQRERERVRETGGEGEIIWYNTYEIHSYKKKSVWNLCSSTKGKMDLSYFFFFFVCLFVALFILHIRKVPSVTPVLSTQMSWIGRHFARSWGGGYYLQQKSHQSKLKKTDEAFLEPDGNGKKKDKKMKWNEPPK